MKSQPYDNRIPTPKQVVKSRGPGSLAGLAEVPGPGQPGTLIRAERTPGEVAVSGKTEPGAGAKPFSSGFPQTNSEPSVKSGGFSIDGLAPLERSPGVAAEGCFGPVEDLSGIILDLYAKRSVEANSGFEKVCPGGIITGSCENGHRFAKVLYCGREWCEVCNGKWERGKAMKPGHARRFARWYPKAQQIDTMGYWTFTIPKELRAKYRTQEALGKLGKDIVKLLRSYGYSRGLRRWHWFGDKSEKWNPHLNCLVDGGHISRRKLCSLRREYSRLLGVKLAIADYHYFDRPGEKVHALTYVTRATFLDARWDVAMALELRGFRNQLWWGSKLWDRPPVWSLDDLPGEQQSDTSDEDSKAVAALELGYCPYDGLAITWGRWQPFRELPGLGGRELGAGYWELPCVHPPPYRPDLSNLLIRDSPHPDLAKTPNGNYVSAELAGSIWAEFFAQHRRWIEHCEWRKALKSGDYSLMSEILSRPKNIGQYRSSPGFSPPTDKTVRMPNCLGGVSVTGKN